MIRGEASTWLSARTPFFLATSKLNRIASSRPSVSFCVNGPAGSTCSSYGRRWSNHRLRGQLAEADLTRHWVEADTSSSESLQERFVVVSYNILGDRNATKHKDLYQTIPSSDMKWDRRKRLICEELLGWSPDVVCLQEVDKYFDLLSYMEKAGYMGSYKQRTGADMVDGCAMFWKADKFRLVAGENIEFREYGLRDNVAQLNVLEMRTAVPRRLVIGNIHVLYYPSRGDCKLGQIRTLFSKAHTISRKWGNIPIVLGGDYNSTPQSPIYKFLSSAELNISSHNRRELSGQRNCHPAQIFGDKTESGDSIFSLDRLFKNGWTREEIKIATGNSDSEVVVHPLKLRSSYATVTGSARTRHFNGEPLATSYHSKFFGTVDYLWYSDGVVPIRVLDTLPTDVLQNTGGLPFKKLGSDHLALVSEYAFLTTEEQKVQ